MGCPLTMSTKDQQHKLQNVQLEILDVIDQICKENDLHYSLYAGTLLGAIRHQDYIPWDDDLDICMSRTDYERFLTVWKDQDHPGYILQNKRNTPSFTQTFTKIRKDHTTFLQFEWEKERYHTGIFVDIFPFDHCPDSFLERQLFCYQCLKYLLYTREFVPPKASLFMRTITKFFLVLSSVNSRKRYRERFEQKLIERSTRNELPVMAIELLSSLSQIYSCDLFQNYIELPFHNLQLPCIVKWDEMLTVLYGDYMKLPPEEERVWKHEHLIIDFEHNYGEES